MLLRIDTHGRRLGRWALGGNWPFSPREFQWEIGVDLDGARRDLARLISMLEAGRGDEILVDPLTRKPFRSADEPTTRWIQRRLLLDDIRLRHEI